jgi:hypothetical protein
VNALHRIVLEGIQVMKCIYIYKKKEESESSILLFLIIREHLFLRPPLIAEMNITLTMI